MVPYICPIKLPIVVCTLLVYIQIKQTTCNLPTFQRSQLRFMPEIPGPYAKLSYTAAGCSFYYICWKNDSQCIFLKTPTSLPTGPPTPMESQVKCLSPSNVSGVSQQKQFSCSAKSVSKQHIRSGCRDLSEGVNVGNHFFIPKQTVFVFMTE